MKQLLLLIALLLQINHLHSQFSDNFSDGNFTNNPGWSGDINNFNINANQELQLNAPNAGSSILTTAYEIPDSCVWECFIKLDFAPSNSNLLRLYLQNNKSELLSGQGYYLEIGETGNNDAIRFFRQDAPNAFVLLGTCSIGAVADQPGIVRLKISRSGTGFWNFSTDYSGGTNFLNEFNVTDNTYLSGQSYFGFYCLYTETRKDKFYFDDIKCYQIQKDLLPPALNSWTIVDSMHIDLHFNENLNKSIAENVTNYILNPSVGNPQQVLLDPVFQNIIHLEFDLPFTSQTQYNLSLLNITDLSSNVLNAFEVNFLYITAVIPKADDIIINEIFADPSPSVGLPAFEFIEILNNSNKVLSLKGLSVSDGVSSSDLPPVIFEPGKFYILCNLSDTTSFKIFGPTLGLKNFPSLNNTSDVIILSNEDGEFINTVNYSDSWYENTLKKEGGWSLELRNPNSKCLKDENWTSSINTLGGTPGMVNSVFNPQTDNQPPVVLRANTINEQTVELIFNEKITEDPGVFLSLFYIDNAINIKEVLPNSNPNSLIISLNNQLSSGITYTLNLSPGFPDCEGNQTNTVQSAEFILPELPGTHDIIINEILFNPRSGGYDFIELYNRSTKAIDLSNFKISNTLKALDQKDISFSRIIYPGEYVVLSEDPENIMMEYNVKDNKAIYLNDLPSFNDDEGVIQLQYISLTENVFIDSFHYNESQHYALLNNIEGVSLELINSEIFSSSYNWQSASTQAGYATPGYLNSQNIDQQNPLSSGFSISSEKLSPDSDGIEDQVQISYSLPASGYTLNMNIYDSSGRNIKNIASNELLGSEGIFKWDGTTNENTKARLGIYIVLIEYFDLNANVLQQKIPVVVASKMN